MSKLSNKGNKKAVLSVAGGSVSEVAHTNSKLSDDAVTSLMPLREMSVDLNRSVRVVDGEDRDEELENLNTKYRVSKVKKILKLLDEKQAEVSQQSVVAVPTDLALNFGRSLTTILRNEGYTKLTELRNKAKTPKWLNLQEVDELLELAKRFETLYKLEEEEEALLLPLKSGLYGIDADVSDQLLSYGIYFKESKQFDQKYSHVGKKESYLSSDSDFENGWTIGSSGHWNVLSNLSNATSANLWKGYQEKYVRAKGRSSTTSRKISEIGVKVVLDGQNHSSDENAVHVRITKSKLLEVVNGEIVSIRSAALSSGMRFSIQSDILNKVHERYNKLDLTESYKAFFIKLEAELVEEQIKALEQEFARLVNVRAMNAELITLPQLFAEFAKTDTYQVVLRQVAENFYRKNKDIIEQRNEIEALQIKSYRELTAAQKSPSVEKFKSRILTNEQFEEVFRGITLSSIQVQALKQIEEALINNSRSKPIVSFNMGEGKTFLIELVKKYEEQIKGGISSYARYNLSDEESAIVKLKEEVNQIEAAMARAIGDQVDFRDPSFAQPTPSRTTPSKAKSSATNRIPLAVVQKLLDKKEVELSQRQRRFNQYKLGGLEIKIINRANESELESLASEQQSSQSNSSSSSSSAQPSDLRNHLIFFDDIYRPDLPEKLRVLKDKGANIVLVGATLMEHKRIETVNRAKDKGRDLNSINAIEDSLAEYRKRKGRAEDKIKSSTLFIDNEINGDWVASIKEGLAAKQYPKSQHIFCDLRIENEAVGNGLETIVDTNTSINVAMVNVSINGEYRCFIKKRGVEGIINTKVGSRDYYKAILASEPQILRNISGEDRPLTGEEIRALQSESNVNGIVEIYDERYSIGGFYDRVDVLQSGDAQYLYLLKDKPDLARIGQAQSRNRNSKDEATKVIVTKARYDNIEAFADLAKKNYEKRDLEEYCKDLRSKIDKYFDQSKREEASVVILNLSKEDCVKIIHKDVDLIGSKFDEILRQEISEADKLKFIRDLRVFLLKDLLLKQQFNIGDFARIIEGGDYEVKDAAATDYLSKYLSDQRLSGISHHSASIHLQEQDYISRLAYAEKTPQCLAREAEEARQKKIAEEARKEAERKLLEEEAKRLAEEEERKRAEEALIKAFLQSIENEIAQNRVRLEEEIAQRNLLNQEVATVEAAQLEEEINHQAIVGELKRNIEVVDSSIANLKATKIEKEGRLKNAASELERVGSDKEKLTTRLQQLAEKKRASEEEVEKLQKQEALKKKSSEDLVQKVKVYEEEIVQVQTELSSAQSAVEALEEDIEVVQNDIKKEQQECANFKQSIYEKDAQIGFITSQISAFERDHQSLSDRVRSLRDEIDEKKVLKESEDKKTKLLQDESKGLSVLIAERDPTIAALQAKLVKAEEERGGDFARIADLKKTSEDLQSEISSLNQVVKKREENIRVLTEQNSASELKLSQLKDREEELRDSESVLMREISSLNEAIEISRESKIRLTTKKSQLVHREGSLSESQKYLESELLGKESQIIRLDEDVEKKEQQREELEDLKKRTLLEVAELQEFIQSKLREIKALETAVSNKRKAVDEKKETIAKQIAAGFSLNKGIAELTENLRTLNQNLAGKKNELSDLDDQLRSKDGEITSAGEDLAALEQDYRKLEKENEKQADEISDLKGRVDSASEEIERVDLELKSKGQTQGELTGQLESKAKEITAKKSQISKLVLSRQEQEEQVAALNAEMKTVAKNLDEKAEALKKANRMIETKQTELDALNADLINEESQLRQAKEAVDAEQARLDKKKGDLVTASGSQSTLEQEIKAQESKISSLQAQRDEVQGALQSLAERTTAETNKLSAAKELMLKLTKDVETAEAEATESLDKIKRLEEEKVVVEAKAGELQNALSISQESCAVLEKSNEKLSLQINALQEKISTMSEVKGASEIDLKIEREKLLALQESLRLSKVEFDGKLADQQFLQQDFIKKQEKIAGLQNESAATQVELENLRQQIQTESANLVEVSEQVAALSSQIANQQSDTSKRLSEEFEKLQKDVDARKAELGLLEEEKRTAQENIKTFTAELIRLRDECQRREALNIALAKKISDLKVQNGAKDVTGGELDSLRLQLGGLEENLAKEQGILEERKKLSENLEGQLSLENEKAVDREKEIRWTQGVLQDLQEQQVQKTAELEDALKQIAEINRKLLGDKGLQDSLDASVARAAELGKSLQGLKDQLIENQSQYAAACRSLEEAQAAIEEKQKQLSNQQGENTANVHDAQERVTKLEGELRALTQQVIELQSRRDDMSSEEEVLRKAILATEERLEQEKKEFEEHLAQLRKQGDEILEQQKTDLQKHAELSALISVIDQTIRTLQDKCAEDEKKSDVVQSCVLAFTTLQKDFEKKLDKLPAITETSSVSLRKIKYVPDYVEKTALELFKMSGKELEAERERIFANKKIGVLSNSANQLHRLVLSGNQGQEITPNNLSICREGGRYREDRRYRGAEFVALIFRDEEINNHTIFNNADLTGAKFKECLFCNVDFSKIAPKVFHQIQFENCKAIGELKIPTNSFSERASGYNLEGIDIKEASVVEVPITPTAPDNRSSVPATAVASPRANNSSTHFHLRGK